MANVVRRRAELQAEFQALHPEGGKLTLTHLVTHSLVRALDRHRNFNVSLTPQNEVVHHQDINISFAVASDNGGILVPCIRAAQTLTLGELARAVGRQAIMARVGQRAPGGRLPVCLCWGSGGGR